MYHQTSLDLSPSQLKKLKAGDKVRLKPTQLSGSHPVFLTTTQMKKVAKAKTEGKGMDLSLSGSQLKHHAMHGGSIWGDIGSFFKDAGSKVFNDVIKPIATDVGLPLAKTLLTGLAQKGADKVTAKLAGSGVPKKRGRKPKMTQGEGFFDDLWSGVKSVVEPVAQVGIPILTNAATQALTKRLGGGVKKPRKGKAGSITLNGY